MSVERLAPEVRTLLREAIAQARGREVSFTAALDAQGQIVRARVLARGTIESVLALPGAAARGEILLHNHPSGVLEPSGADLAVAARLHDAGVGFGIVDNEVTDVYVVVEVPRARAVNRLDPWAVAGMLDHDGPVARVLGGVGGTFEDRPGQRDMAAHVADAYNDGGVAALEAGTGIGKSFAYLVPALEWAAANGERTVVSTNTINLQEQLVGKDLPLLARALADGERVPSFALLKGWRNYLCLARLEQARAGQESLFETGRASELDMLDAWASRTADGSLSDLATEPSPDVWDAVAAESDLCPRLKCPHFERCFLFQARRRAAEADVVVVNHHLLASDLAVRLAADNWIEAAVLPPYRRLIVDEAHHLEDVAAQHLGAQVSALGVQRLLGRFERNGRGLLPTLAAELALHDDAASHASLDLVHKSLLDALRAARQSAETLFALLDQRLGEARGDTPVLRLGDAFKDDVVWTQGLDVALDNLLTSFGRLRDGIETIADRMGGEDLSDRRAQLIGELRGVVRRLDAASIGLVATLSPPPGGSPTVRWLERRGRRPPHVALASVPLDLAPLLRETLWDRVDTAILTSATLAPGGEFTFLESRLGLDLPPARQGVREVLDSPFDYATQCLFGIPTDLPEPREDAAHDQAVAEAVVAMAQMADGGMFVLFTSHAALRRAAQAVRGRLDPRWPLLVQGDAPRDKLLRRFREAGSAILLGTDSFWEGVDVPGRALRALILAKLPFKVPSEPLTAARLERLEARGVDGFTHYLVPHAALKLKQGFGRLIRTRADVGAVVLLDRRAVVKPYGRALLAGLPRAARVVGSWADVLDACGALFAREAASREYVEG